MKSVNLNALTDSIERVETCNHALPHDVLFLYCFVNKSLAETAQEGTNIDMLLVCKNKTLLLQR